MSTTTVSETILTTSPDAAPAPAVLKKVIGKVDSHGRALAKAVTWRVVGTTDTFVCWRLVGSLDTFILSYVITGKAHYAVSIMGAEAITKIVLYYFHERIWRRVSWGRLEDTKATATAS